ncbi:MAG: mannosyltransferase [Flavobacteriaceae bacterium]|nr:mannosyltransferase [Flavobacteriaceae bacterium]
MIPKIIHYCWFGPGEMPESFQRCLKSWKEFCPEFEIREWNEVTARDYLQAFARDALRKRKYAFAADAVRTKVLYEMGGIYLDTDMLLLKPIDELLDYNFFTGYEVHGRPAYGIFGAIPNHPLIKEMASFYKDERFNQFSPPVITHTFKDIIAQNNLGDNDRIFAPEAFYALPYEHKDEDYKNFISEDSYAVHLWDHSWNTEKKNGFWQMARNFNTVCIDRFFYGYPKAYFKRYAKEFGRKMYHRIFKRKLT